MRIKPIIEALKKDNLITFRYSDAKFESKYIHAERASQGFLFSAPQGQPPDTQEVVENNETAVTPAILL